MRHVTVLGWGLVLTVLSWNAIAYEMPAGRMKAVAGSVTAEKEGVRRPLTIGDAVYAGERIRTAIASSAALMLRDDTRISLGEKSSMQVERFEYDTTRQDGNMVISVFRGVTAFVSGLLSKSGDGRVKVLAPNATIGVRGTEFIVDVAAGDEEETAKPVLCSAPELMRRGCWGN